MRGITLAIYDISKIKKGGGGDKNRICKRWVKSKKRIEYDKNMKNTANQLTT